MDVTPLALYIHTPPGLLHPKTTSFVISSEAMDEKLVQPVLAKLRMVVQSANPVSVVNATRICLSQFAKIMPLLLPATMPVSVPPLAHTPVDTTKVGVSVCGWTR